MKAYCLFLQLAVSCNSSKMQQNKVIFENSLVFRTVWLIKLALGTIMSGSSHIRSVLIGVEYWNCCLFTLCYLDGANSIKIDLHICNLWTGQFVSYNFVIKFWFNLPKQNMQQKVLNSQYFWKWTNANPMKILGQLASHPKLLIGSKLTQA